MSKSIIQFHVSTEHAIYQEIVDRKWIPNAVTAVFSTELHEQSWLEDSVT